MYTESPEMFIDDSSSRLLVIEYQTATWYNVLGIQCKFFAHITIGEIFINNSMQEQGILV